MGMKKFCQSSNADHECSDAFGFDKRFKSTIHITKMHRESICRTDRHRAFAQARCRGYAVRIRAVCITQLAHISGVAIAHNEIAIASHKPVILNARSGDHDGAIWRAPAG